MKLDWNRVAEIDKQYVNPDDAFRAGKVQHNIANTAFPIAHTLTMADYKVPIKDRKQVAVDSWDGVDEMGLYVHVPFCEKRCGFCEYTVVGPQNHKAYEQKYFDLLMKEFDLYKDQIDSKNKKVIGFDIGGGTPSIASVDQIQSVVDKAGECFDMQKGMRISIETTPKIAATEPEKIKAYKDMGIDRISMGVQSVSPKLLDDLGRTNTTIDWNRQATENIRKAGFDMFNVDIMYGFAGQTVKGVQATLAHVLSLDPEFVTVYRTRYKGTKIASQMERVYLQQVNEQSKLIKEMLSDAGYDSRIGKNTFSKIDGDYGTSDYLTKRVIEGTPYLGLGLGSQTFNHKTLSYNIGAATKEVDPYEIYVGNGRLPVQDVYHLSLPVAIAKFVSVSFYFGGINMKHFYKNFGVKFEQYFKDQMQYVIENGMMELVGDDILLTQQGNYNFNGVISLFYSPGVQKYLIDKCEQDGVKI